MSTTVPSLAFYVPILASNMPSISLIKLQLEEYLWRCPDRTSTQVKLKPGFEASTSYKLDYSAYGFTKLTFMLEAMSDTIKVSRRHVQQSIVELHLIM